jgi:hypothetical protein
VLCAFGSNLESVIEPSDAIAAFEIVEVARSAFAFRAGGAH